MIVWGHQA